MKIDFIGYGEAAFELSSGLHQEGVTNLAAYDVMGSHEHYGVQIKKMRKLPG